MYNNYTLQLASAMLAVVYRKTHKHTAKHTSEAEILRQFCAASLSVTGAAPRQTSHVLEKLLQSP